MSERKSYRIRFTVEDQQLVKLLDTLGEFKAFRLINVLVPRLLSDFFEGCSTPEESLIRAVSYLNDSLKISVTDTVSRSPEFPSGVLGAAESSEEVVEECAIKEHVQDEKHGDVIDVLKEAASSLLEEEES